MKISVVMPVYNEVHTIEEILSRVEKVAIKKEIIPTTILKVISSKH